MADSDSEKASENTEDLAEERINWAEDRTILANERTFSSRIGLVLGSLGLAIGLQGVFKAVEPTWVAKSVATGFVLIGIFVAVGSYFSSAKMLRRLNSHTSDPVSSRGLLIISGSCVAGSLGVMAVLWLS